jgi:replication initiation and membrane attachment protein DnaB
MPIQVEIPDWLAELYRQIERELGRIEKFIHDSHTANQNVAEILPSLVEEYQMLLKTQHQLFDQAVNNNNQLLDLNRKQFGLIELKSLNFASHVEAALNLIMSSASTEFENLRSRLEGQIQANVKLHSYTEDLQKNAEMAYCWQTLEIQNLQARSSRSDQTVRTAETNLSALKDEIRKANRNITALQK